MMDLSIYDVVFLFPFKDCIDAIMSLIKQNKSYVIGIGVGVLVIEVRYFYDMY